MGLEAGEVWNGVRVKVGFKDSVGVLRPGGEGCYVGKGKNFRAPPHVWPAAIDPW